MTAPAQSAKDDQSNDPKIHIVGIGDDGLSGLTTAAKNLLDEADVVIGMPHTLGLVGSLSSELIPVDGSVDTVAGHIERHQGKRVAVLATGDPLFYGVARYLCDKLGKDRFEVVPNVSTMQMAFARVKESWDEAYLSNLATQNLSLAIEKIRIAERAGLFTTEAYPPSKVAQALLDRKIDYFNAYVCENLGSPDERVTFAELGELAEMQFAPLNVMILIRRPDTPDRPREMVGRRLFGNPDELFLQSKPKRGLLTSAEVRVLALAEMDLGTSSIIWDVGAGSGAVAIEAASIAYDGTTYAIEMDPEDHQLITSNAERFNVPNLVPVLGRAPEAWAELPPPDAIFVGGTGRAVGDIVAAAFEQLKPGGRLVVNVASIESLSVLREFFRATLDDMKIRMVSIAQGTDQLDVLRFEALNPSFILSVIKPA